jgi:hypothetical protein
MSIDLTRGPYTHLIVEAPLDPALKRSWKVIDAVDGFAGWHIDKTLVNTIRRVDVAGIGVNRGFSLALSTVLGLQICHIQTLFLELLSLSQSAMRLLQS